MAVDIDGERLSYDLPPLFDGFCENFAHHASLPGDNRALEPPDSIPNSVVKRCIADGSVGLPHVRVGHRQASKNENPSQSAGVFYCSAFRIRPVFVKT